MSLIGRNAGLTLAALLALVLVLAKYFGAPAPRAPAPAIPVVAPAQAAAPAVKTKRPARRKLLAVLPAPPPGELKVRGSRLKDKGEALGGRTPDRVDTGTMTVPAAQ